VVSRAIALLMLLSCACARTTAPGWSPPAPRPPGDRASAEPPDLPAPMNPAVRTGKLANGLTYYVLPHARSERRAALRLVVRAGSMQEDDDQGGFAHFVEHVAFSGTARFPKGEILGYLERVGMAMGADFNAHTNFDDTTYELTVPTDDRAVVLKGIDILRDVAGDATFDPAEVERERRAVLEEDRVRHNAAGRIGEREMQAYYAGSRYASRWVIGHPDVNRAAKRADLVRFYKDWYRPDLMAVVAVGDVDPDAMEAEIRSRFASLVNPTIERLRRQDTVPRSPDLRISITPDPETGFTVLSIADRIDQRPEVTQGDFRRRRVAELFYQMQRFRLSELCGEKSSPMVSAWVGLDRLNRTADAILWTVRVKEGRLPDAIRQLAREVARTERYGFQHSELVRARAILLAGWERGAREHDKSPLATRADEIIRNFLVDEAMPGPEVEMAWIRDTLPVITLAEIDSFIKSWRGDEGRILAVSAPSNALPVNEAVVRRLVDEGRASPAGPWVDNPWAGNLIDVPPQPGAIVSAKHDDATDVTVWTLANGIRVLVKPTTFRNDQVVFRGWKTGGTSLLSDADFVHARFASAFMNDSGVGDIHPYRLNRVLAGKDVDVAMNIAARFETVSGHARTQDLETMLQLLYLRLTRPRRDEGAFAIWKARAIEYQRHRRDTPEQRHADEIDLAVFGNHPREQPITTSDITAVDLDRAFAIWKERLADLAGLTLVFVGNVDLPRLMPLVETYIGSLPVKGKPQQWKDPGINYPSGAVEKVVKAGRDPKALMWIGSHVATPWSLDAWRDAGILQMILSIRLRETLRENEGGTYHVSAHVGFTREPTERGFLNVSFTCAPERADQLRGVVFTELAAIARDGIGDEYLAKVSEQLRRGHESDVRNNGWWLDQLVDATYLGYDFTDATDLAARVKRVTSANVRATAGRLFDGKRYVVVVLRPE
jgi:zinc protease